LDAQVLSLIYLLDFLIAVATASSSLLRQTVAAFQQDPIVAQNLLKSVQILAYAHNLVVVGAAVSLVLLDEISFYITA
jgi:hypothetical protein